MRKAFTMIELVLVIVIMGILAVASAMFLPNHTLINDSNFVAMQLKRVQARAIGNNQWKLPINDYNCIELSKTALNVKKSTNGGYSLHKNTIITSTKSRVCFDHIGKPYDGYVQNGNNLPSSVNIIVSYKSKSKTIKILPYSGYIQMIQN